MIRNITTLCGNWKQTIFFHEVQYVITNIVIYSLSFWYHSIEIDTVASIETKIFELQEELELSILCVPLISTKQDDKHKFTAISENCAVRKEYGLIELPHVTSDIYLY